MEHDSLKEIKTLIVFNHLGIGKKVGLFRRHIKRHKKISLQHKYEYIKNSMVTGIVQKRYKAQFPLWSLKKEIHCN